MSDREIGTAEKLVREVEAELENTQKSEVLIPHAQKQIIKLLLAIWYQLP